MKATTRKYFRLLDACNKIIRELSRVTISDSKREALEKKESDYSMKMSILQSELEESEYYEYLESIYGMSYAEFIKN